MDETEAKGEPEPEVKSVECDDEDAPITTTTKNALITTQLDPCDVYPHRVKVSIVGVGKIGIACAIAILMRRMASEVCLIDHDANKASAEAEDIQHVGFFLGCPLVTGTSVPLWSSISVGGMKLRDINSRIGEQDDPERWYEIEENVKSVGKELEEKKGSCCWGVAISTTEIVDAIVRNTKVVLPASTHILRLASELVFIDVNEELAKAEAEDISHGAAFLGNPKIIGTKDYSLARDATVCVITIGDRSTNEQDPSTLLEQNLNIFKDVIPKVCKYAPNSILLIVTAPVDILSYAAMKLSGFPPHRVVGLGTFLDSCRFQYFIAQKLGISASSVQASVICENGPTSVPIWSAVTVMGIKLKDINKDIGTKADPESWGELHAKVIDCDNDLISRKGYRCWGMGICAAEVVDAIVRNTCICVTVSTYLKAQWGSKRKYSTDR
ncbi:L-lactate dehydrogenase A chain-like isoform X2 [Apis cerana]|uniref:L-lactate dehydrogenase A chain-like isoform X2 n=1 Tax=Apis cerana TaxID=7461 RepID=UPI002B2346DF|nr:L-lactate dehydrogenase A chain-like isoform X2 [Apis cerana]